MWVGRNRCLLSCSRSERLCCRKTYGLRLGIVGTCQHISCTCLQLPIHSQKGVLEHCNAKCHQSRLVAKPVSSLPAPKARGPERAQSATTAWILALLWCSGCTTVHSLSTTLAHEMRGPSQAAVATCRCLRMLVLPHMGLDTLLSIRIEDKARV